MSEGLPITEHRGEIISCLRKSQVMIVCGDTGSGKTTQLPQMALAVGRAARGKRIAVTQPRRLAAVTMAERVASELNTELGGVVGFRHRFGRKITADTRIEFMTDGILLTETRFDPLLRAYDTIIVDEAHERSLNVDFLLGILKRILEKRHDLKVIVASATLDTERFSAFFGNAPTITVPGRLFPIAMRYMPPDEDGDTDLPHEIAAAVRELPTRDDILVFLPGERDIRESAEYLDSVFGGINDIIPLLASLPAAEQRRAFLPSNRRRIILATNVAETSVTIPGIKAVIDSGLARISRYIHRTQVQRLQIEGISQASAKQRAGRCGRVGPGTCIRLYSEEDFLSRDAYTPPEVLRSSLAGVILTMLDLRLGDIEQFPFIDPPKPAMIREGLKELLELGAICRGGDGGPALTEIGRKLAKIPVEPRLARMMIAASRNATLPSVLPLVAAMACDDPKRRPIDESEKADQAHAKFRVAGSDFLGTLKLWHWWEDETKELSQAKARKLCKANYLSFPKMREWRDLTRQLTTLSQRLGLDTLNDNGGEDMLHRSLLAGLLGRIGRFDEEERDYRGAHGLRFQLHPSSVLTKRKQNRKAEQTKGEKSNEWVMAGELVDTTRLFARNAATIDVRWLEPVAGEICKHNYHSPEWDAQSGFVRATEQVTLYGLVIVPARRCDYSRINPTFAREIFIRSGLVRGDFPRPTPPIRANLEFLRELRLHAEKCRHPEFFDADRIQAHFDAVIPPEICSANTLKKWLKAASANEVMKFTLKRTDWWPDESQSSRDFPENIQIAGAKIALRYCHAPDDPERDGITCSVRKRDAAALRLWRSDWLVPGMLGEKVSWMLSVLPTSLRRILQPLDETITILMSLLKPGTMPLEDAVRTAIEERWAFHIPADAWQRVRMPPHLKIRFQIRDDETGKVLASSRDLEEVLTAVGSPKGVVATGGRNDANAIATTWTFGEIPEKSCDRNAGWATEHYPALHDEGEGVRVKLYSDRQEAERAHATAVTRLFYIALKKQYLRPFRRKGLPFDSAYFLKDRKYEDAQVAEDILCGAIAEAMVRGRPAVRNQAEFERRLEECAGELTKVQSEIITILIETTAMAAQILRKIEDSGIGEETAISVNEQISWLLYRGFPKFVPLERLRHYKRFLKGAMIRLDRARLSASSDRAKEQRFAPYWQRYRDAMAPGNQQKTNRKALQEYRWMTEELRISIFAQELHTPVPVSEKRLESKWSEVKL